ncbi:MAG: hypothetical protein N3A01_01445 [Bacteroidales bacterium]|nr:hypothetical protein [Bacteroidales bacterium]
MGTFNYYYLLRKSVNSFLRFPLVIVFSLITFIAGCFYVLGYKNTWQHLFYISATAIPFFISLTLILEKYETSKKFNYIINFVFVLIFFLVFINSPLKEFYLKHFYRYIFLFISFTFSIFYLPYLGFNNKLSFWHFNRVVLKCFSLSFLYAATILISLSILIWAVFEMFNFDNVYKVIYIISLFSLTFILPWLFISGIPKQKIYNTHFISTYPESLLNLTNNLLIPLQILFFISLFIIIVIKSFIFPNVSSYFILLKLLIFYFCLNISIISIVHPVLFEEKNVKLLKFINLSLVFSLFLLALYFYLLFEVYDISVFFINRYIYAIIGICFAVIFVYLLLKQIKDIRVIPLSIMILSLISVSGPWNFLNQYKNYLLKSLETNLNKEVKEYFISLYGLPSLCKKIKTSECLEKNITEAEKLKTEESFKHSINPYIKIIPQYKIITLQLDKKTTLVSFNFNKNHFEHIFTIDNDTGKIVFNPYINNISIFLNNSKETDLKLDSLLKRVADYKSKQEIALSQNELKFTLRGKKNNFNLFLDAISLKYNIETKQHSIESINGFILITKK